MNSGAPASNPTTSAAPQPYVATLPSGATVPFALDVPPLLAGTDDVPIKQEEFDSDNDMGDAATVNDCGSGDMVKQEPVSEDSKQGNETSEDMEMADQDEASDLKMEDEMKLEPDLFDSLQSHANDGHLFYVYDGMVIHAPDDGWLERVSWPHTLRAFNLQTNVFLFARHALEPSSQWMRVVVDPPPPPPDEDYIPPPPPNDPADPLPELKGLSRWCHQQARRDAMRRLGAQ